MDTSGGQSSRLSVHLADGYPQRCPAGQSLSLAMPSATYLIVSAPVSRISKRSIHFRWQHLASVWVAVAPIEKLRQAARCRQWCIVYYHRSAISECCVCPTRYESHGPFSTLSSKLKQLFCLAPMVTPLPYARCRELPWMALSSITTTAILPSVAMATWRRAAPKPSLVSISMGAFGARIGYPSVSRATPSQQSVALNRLPPIPPVETPMMALSLTLSTPRKTTMATTRPTWRATTMATSPEKKLSEPSHCGNNIHVSNAEEKSMHSFSSTTFLFDAKGARPPILNLCSFQQTPTLYLHNQSKMMQAYFDFPYNPVLVPNKVARLNDCCVHRRTVN